MTNDRLPDPPESRSDLTVVVVTYNQEATIGQALASVAAQTIVKQCRVILSDDASTDGTVERARSEAVAHGLDLEVVRQPENLGISRHYEVIFNCVDTPLVAILEGDDYWLDAGKLERQREAMVAYWTATACVTPLVPFDVELDIDVFQNLDFEVGKLTILGTRELVNSGGYCFSTLMFRTRALQSLPTELFAQTAYDWITLIMVSRLGPVIHLNHPSTAYRRGPGGTWSAMSPEAQIRAWRDAIVGYVTVTGDDVRLANLLLNKQAGLANDLKHMRVAQRVARALPPSLHPAARRIRALMRRSS